jgi:hypothetical protein
MIFMLEHSGVEAQPTALSSRTFQRSASPGAAMAKRRSMLSGLVKALLYQMIAAFAWKGDTSDVAVLDIVVIAKVFADITFGARGKRFNVS